MDINLDNYDIHACRIIANWVYENGKESAYSNYGKAKVEIALKVLEEWKKL